MQDLSIIDNVAPEPGANANLASLSEQTQQLYSIFLREAPRLAQMLYGAWSPLGDASNAEALVHSAHSARELMEKAPSDIPDVPVEQGSGSLANDVRALHGAWIKIKATTWISTPPWSGEIDQGLSGWLGQAEGFFNNFAVQHQTRASQVRAAITSLDQSGQPIPENLIVEKIKEWQKLRDYFVKVAHHNHITDRSILIENLSKLEIFLLNLMYPQPIPDLEDVEALILEGEAQ